MPQYMREFAEAYQLALYCFMAPVLLIWFIIRVRQLRRLPLLAVPVRRLYVSRLRLVIAGLIILAVSVLSVLVFSRDN
jgi:hypothetical protein